MKINFVVPEIVRSGGIRVIFEFASRLVNKGHNVTLYSPIVPFNIYRGSLNLSFSLYRVRTFVKYLLGNNPLPANIFEHNFTVKFVPSVTNLFVHDADAVIATAWQTAESVHRLTESKGKKFYLVQDYEIWYGNPIKINESYRLPLNKIVISEYLKNLLKEKFGADSTKLLIGRDYEKFNNRNKVYHNPRTILFIDHVLENRNTKGAIEILERLKQKYPEIRILCFGLSKFHRIPEFMEFYENPDDELIVQLYCASDIFLFTSKYEGFGGPPAEAMACKCAVVGNAVGALPEYAINNETAILANPDNPDELYNGICYLLDNEKEVMRISEAGYNHVKKILNWDNIIDEFEMLLKEA
jgi:glycosyltransferase involved in cell wall biosynthesis